MVDKSAIHIQPGLEKEETFTIKLQHQKFKNKIQKFSR